MKRQRWTIGAVVKIPMEDSYHCYAQLLDKASIAVFDLMTKEEYLIEDILKNEVLFIVAIYSNIIPSGRWPKIGKGKLKEKFHTLPMKFIQDVSNHESVELYNPNTGEITKSNKQACAGLERASVWAANHIEDRLRDHFLGIENVWVKQLDMK